MTSLLTILPLEIIEEIIDDVALLDAKYQFNQFPSTKACSSTCYTFLQPSRKHIFRSITVHNGGEPNYATFTDSGADIRCFAKLLTLNPELGHHVRDLKYNILVEKTGLEPLEDSFLHHINKLEDLVIDNDTDLGWNTLPSSSRSTLLHLIHKPTIASISLSSMLMFPLSILVPCIHLRKLHFRYVSSDDGDDALSKPFNPIQLHELNIDVEAILPSFMKRLEAGQRLPFDFRRIERVNLYILCHNNIEPSTTIRFLEYFGRLTHLQISAFGVKTAILPRFVQLAIPFLPTLRSLRLDGALPSFESNMHGIPDALEKLAKTATNCIDTLAIHLQLPDGWSPVPERESPARDGWARFEDVILGPDWPCLQHFELMVCYYLTYGNPGNRQFKEAQKKFPRINSLSSNGSSKFKYVEAFRELSPFCT